jgi:hypothetical protein
MHDDRPDDFMDRDAMRGVDFLRKGAGQLE